MAQPSQSPPPEAPEQLPAPSSELVLLRVAMESFLQVSGRKKGEQFIRAMADALATEESVASVLPIRPASDHAAISKARRGAVALFRQLLPLLIARLPPK